MRLDRAQTLLERLAAMTCAEVSELRHDAAAPTQLVALSRISVDLELVMRCATCHELDGLRQVNGTLSTIAGTMHTLRCAMTPAGERPHRGDPAT